MNAAALVNPGQLATGHWGEPGFPSQAGFSNSEKPLRTESL